MMRALSIAILCSLYIQSSAQQFMDLVEFKVSTGIGYHGSLGSMSSKLGPAIFNTLDPGDDILNLANNTLVNKLPFEDDIFFFFEDDLFFGSFFDLRAIAGDYTRSNVEMRVHLGDGGFGKYSTLGLQLGTTHFHERTNTLTSANVIVIQPNVFDSVFVDWDFDEDTVLAIPRARNLAFSSQMSSIDFGLNYSVQMNGEPDGKFRMFLGLGYRMRILKNLTTARVSYVDYSFRSIIYDGYMTRNPITGEVAQLSLLNPDGREDRNIDLDVPTMICPSYVVSLSCEWRLSYFPVYWGFQTEVSVQHYRLGGARLDTNHSADLRLHMVYYPALLNEWRSKD